MTPKRRRTDFDRPTESNLIDRPPLVFRATPVLGDYVEISGSCVFADGRVGTLCRGAMQVLDNVTRATTPPMLKLTYDEARLLHKSLGDAIFAIEESRRVPY